MAEHYDEIEFHDSTLKKIERDCNDLVLYMDAHVHRLTDQRIWQMGFWQPVKLKFLSAQIDKEQLALPIGLLDCNTRELRSLFPSGLVPLPKRILGELELVLGGMDDQTESDYVTFRIASSGVETEPAGDPHNFEYHFVGEQW